MLREKLRGRFPRGMIDLDRVDSGPGALVADELGLVQGVEAYQGIVVGAC